MSSRLELIASFASQGRGVADIGTDHAILPIILRRNGYSGYIVAGDINEGPLKKAERGLLEAEVDDVANPYDCEHDATDGNVPHESEADGQQC